MVERGHDAAACKRGADEKVKDQGSLSVGSSGSVAARFGAQGKGRGFGCGGALIWVRFTGGVAFYLEYRVRTEGWKQSARPVGAVRALPNRRFGKLLQP